MLQLWNFLSGKKTYIVGILTVILGLLNNDTQMVLSGIAMLTIRHAISTSSAQ